MKALYLLLFLRLRIVNQFIFCVVFKVIFNHERTSLCPFFHRGQINYGLHYGVSNLVIVTN